MERPTLRITPKKYAGETTIVSMRIAKDLLKDIDAVASITGRNRNEILTMSLEFALNHMEVVMKEREERDNTSGGPDTDRHFHHSLHQSIMVDE